MATIEQQNFINKLGIPARADFERTNILPSLIIAQGILESGWGKSALAINGNNLFGIRGDFNGESILGTDKDIDRNGNPIPVIVPFRKYPSFAESIKDHADMLTKPRYLKVVQAKDYKQGAQALFDSGYAGDVNYPAKLIEIIEKYKLHEWDQVEIYHMVVSGDTVSLLAKKYDSLIADIKRWNYLNDKYVIKIGQKLRVK
ncbi:glucosaminidase domain-containing protein [Peribacillus sp. NPDC097295]|uniref:glucosaminidase domain-containing protein n=1 Tax=Peribacillus sp. NPDC097295 TaxID=3364402 RepID=UPI00381D3B1E